MNTHTSVGQFFPTCSQLFPKPLQGFLQGSHKDPARTPQGSHKDLQGLVGFCGKLWIPCGLACGISGESLDSLWDPLWDLVVHSHTDLQHFRVVKSSRPAGVPNQMPPPLCVLVAECRLPHGWTSGGWLGKEEIPR